ncbi:MAG: hypothetical protein U9P80_01335 [Thermodesulfobacteriota bacterium]|nr:hypothetical protein [Thermodesulfobacteriota bacterium]
MGLKEFSELKDRFAAGTTPDPSDLRGYYAVKLITGILPDIRFFSHRKFFPPNVEEREGTGGYNEFLGLIRIGNFKIGVIDSILGDGQKVLRVNYNREGNPFWVRPLNDELKKIRDGYYLGRGIFDIGGHIFNTFYFSIEKM